MNILETSGQPFGQRFKTLVIQFNRTLFKNSYHGVPNFPQQESYDDSFMSSSFAIDKMFVSSQCIRITNSAY